MEYRYSATGNILGLLLEPATTPSPWDRWSSLAQNRPDLDGLLILSKSLPAHFELFILNRDGSNGQFCGNGLLIAAYHLFRHDPDFQGELFMAGQRIRCEPQETSLIWLDHIGHWLGPATASLSGILYHGYRVQLANPHWVLLQQVTPAWLACHGKTLERAFLPETLINVEFVWLDPQGIWQVQLFERGVGMTAASGSGAMAIHRTLLELGKITPNEWINLQMPGGMLSTYWDGARYGLRGAVHPFGKRLL